MAKATPLLIATLLSLAGGCAAEHLTGVEVMADDPLEAADHTLQALLDLTRRAEGEFDPKRGRDAKLLLETYLALGRLPDDPARVMGEAVSDPGRPPLLLFPRLTFPAIRPGESASEGENATWRVPILLNEHALYWSEFAGNLPPRGRDAPIGWLIAPTSEVEAGVANIDSNLAFWLESFTTRRNPVRLVVSSRGDPSKREPLTGGVDGRYEYALDPFAPDDGYHGAVLETPPGFALAAGSLYCNLRILPKVVWKDHSETKLGQLLSSGNWYELRDELEVRLRHREWNPRLVQDLQSLADCLDDYPFPYFNSLELEDIADAIRCLPEHPSTRVKQYEAWGELDLAIRQLLDERLLKPREQTHAYPVLLERAEDQEKAYSFIVAADLQYHGSMHLVRAFFATLDEKIMTVGSPPSMERRQLVSEDSRVGIANPSSASSSYHHFSPEVLAEIRSAKFVVIAGDLADGAAGSNPPSLALNFVGVLPPESVYTHGGGGGEFHNLREEFRKLDMPIFAVPGNHDGYVGYGGLLNWPIQFLSNGVLQGTTASELLDKVNGFLPVLVKLRFSRLNRFGNSKILEFLDDYAPIPLDVPNYDGLNEYYNTLGPLNFSFSYRDCSFVGLNSFALPQSVREAVGPVTFAWGGGVRDEDVVWFDTNLRYHQSKSQAKRQFVFMHHDPRASTPNSASYDSGPLGSYHHVDNLLGLFTLGAVGLGYSSYGSLFVPFLTPASNYLQHLAGQTESQQEWMRGMWANPFDTTAYNAKSLIRSINRNIQTPVENGVSHVFFGHDNVPSAPTTWLEEGTVFPAHRRWGLRHWRPVGYAIFPFTRNPNAPAPAWTREYLLDLNRANGNAEVHRLDDIGDAFGGDHGFHLVSVTPQESGRPRVTVRYIRLP